MKKIIQTQAFLYCNLLVLFFLLNGICARSAWRLDLSRDQINSVSESTARVFQALDEPVLIEAFISKEVTGEISGETQLIFNTLYEMDRVAGEKLKLLIYNPDHEDLRNKAQERGIQGVQIAQQKEIESSVRLGYFGLYVQKGEQSTVIPLLDGNWFVKDLEYRLLREIKSFGRGGEYKSNIAFAMATGSPEIYAWTRQQDQNKDNFYGFKNTLSKELGAVDSIELNLPIPARIQSLILMGLPELAEKEIYNLDQFLMRGGNLICMFSSFEFTMQLANARPNPYVLGGSGKTLGRASIKEKELAALNEWLGKYGITLRGEIIIEPSQPMPIWDFKGSFPKQILYPAWAVYTREAGNIVAKDPALKGIEQLVFPWFSSLDVKNAKQAKLKFHNLVQSSSRAVSLKSTSLDYSEIQRMSQSANDFIGRQVPLAVLASGSFKSAYSKANIPNDKDIDKSLHRSEQLVDSTSNLLVIGTSYLLSDVLLQNQIGIKIFSLNNSFLLNLLELVEGDTDLADARGRQSTISTLIVSSSFVSSFISWTFSLGLPLLIGIFGVMRLVNRNKKRGLS